MNEQFFLERIKKIERFYGDKEFNYVQIEAWYEAFKKLNEAQFDYLIKQSFEKFTFKPTLAQMIDLKKEILTNVKRTESDMKYEKEKCDKCKNAGVIKYVKTIDNINYDYYARCTCKNSLPFKSLPYISDITATQNKKVYEKSKDEPQIDNIQQQDIKKYLSQIGMNVNER